MKIFTLLPLFYPIFHFNLILSFPSWFFCSSVLAAITFHWSQTLFWFISHGTSIWDSSTCKDQSSITMWLPLIVLSSDVFLLGHWRHVLWAGTLSVFIVMGGLISWKMCKFHVLSTKDCEARLLIYVWLYLSGKLLTLEKNKLMEWRLSWHKSSSGMLSSLMIGEKKSPSVNILPESPFLPSQRHLRIRTKHILELSHWHWEMPLWWSLLE